MNEGNRFVVEVVGTLKEPLEVTVSRVSEALGLDAARAGKLVTRMPGVITKPMAEGRAMKIALRMQEAGVPALHRPLSEDEDPFKTGEGLAGSVLVPQAFAGHEAASPAVGGRVDAAAASDMAEASAAPREPVDFSDVPSVDATHHDLEVDPKLTPMSEAGFGAADIVIPTHTLVKDDAPRVRSTFVEAGPTSIPTPQTEDPAVTMVRSPGSVPMPAIATKRSGRSSAPTPLPDAGVVAGDARRAGTPVYRQTRSSAEPPLAFAPPPDEVLKRSGVNDADLPGLSGRRRGRFGRHLAAQVALPGLLTWSLTAVALWSFLGSDREAHFVVLAAASAVAALIGALIAALGTIGVSRDVVRLRDEARRVAMGELTSPVSSNRDDELGELAGSLERMRLSLQEGLERLRQRKR